MGSKVGRVALSALVAVFGCSGASESETQPAAPTCPAPELSLPDGTCIRPGILPGGCAGGFEHDGEYGCTPILPPAACAASLMAVPGDSACRPVMACGDGKWGDIPIDATTLHVDRNSAATDPDGSIDRPFTTVSAAVAAAPNGALLAIAEGSYQENVIVQGKALRLWGVCAERVEIVGSFQASSCPPAAVCVASFADGTELHGIALRGAGIGVAVSGSQGVLLDRVWVHDNDYFGIDAESTLGATSLTIVDSLVEDNHEAGILAMAIDLTLERTVVRETLPRQVGGTGIVLQMDCIPSATNLSCDPTKATRGTVRGAVIELNHDGMVAAGAEATIEATVFRGNLSSASNPDSGKGLVIQAPCGQLGGEPLCDPTFPSRVYLSGSYLAQNQSVGVRVAGSEATIETTVIRDQLPTPGRAVVIRGVCVELLDGSFSCDPHTSSRATVRSSLLQNNQNIGLLVAGSEATVEGTVIRATQPRATDLVYGRGIGVQLSCSETEDAVLLCHPDAPGHATVRGSLVADNHGEGVHVVGSTARVESSVVSHTKPRVDGLFGDGVAVFSDLAPASIEMVNTRIQNSARAGVAAFGASASLESTHVQCASFELNGEDYLEYRFSFVNAGQVLCGCPQPDDACKAVSVGLTPPAAAAD